MTSFRKVTKAQRIRNLLAELISDCTEKNILQWSITWSNQEVLLKTLAFSHLCVQSDVWILNKKTLQTKLRLRKLNLKLFLRVSSSISCWTNRSGFPPNGCVNTGIKLQENGSGLPHKGPCWPLWRLSLSDLCQNLSSFHRLLILLWIQTLSRLSGPGRPRTTGLTGRRLQPPALCSGGSHGQNTSQISLFILSKLWS